MFINDAPFKNDYLGKASETRMKQACRYGKCQTEASTNEIFKSCKNIRRDELEEKFEIELEKGLSA
jgi:hypothetical protein